MAVGASLLVGCSAQEEPGAPATSEEASAGLAEVLSGGLDERSQVPAPLQETTWRVVSVVRGAESEDVESCNPVLASASTA